MIILLTFEFYDGASYRAVLFGLKVACVLNSEIIIVYAGTISFCHLAFAQAVMCSMTVLLYECVSNLASMLS